MSEDWLSSVDEERRSFLQKFVIGTAFAVPLMMSFSMDCLSPDAAEAQASNQPPSVPEPNTLLLLGSGAAAVGAYCYARSKRKKTLQDGEPKVD